MTQFYRFAFTLVLFYGGFGLAGRAQSLGSATVAGHVATESDEPLVGATVLVKGTFVGASTNSAGDFILGVGERAFPLTLTVAYQGYESQDVVVSSPAEHVDAILIPQKALTNQLVVAASRREENILQAPVTVEKVTAAQVQRLSTPDLVSGLAQFRGVDANVSGFLVNSLSTRGFGNPTSERVVQLVDYLDTQGPSLSFNIGNSLSIPEVDVASVEILSGPSSVLYGANAFNGVVLINSKDAFTDPGLTVRLRGGERSYLDGQLRYAQRLGRRWAFKLTGSALSATDWTAANYDAAEANSLTSAPNNPAGSNLGYNAVNRYGDLPYTYGATGGALAGRTIYLPGFTETELLTGDNQARLFRVSPAVSYLLSDRVKATLEYSHTTGTTTLQYTNRFRANNFTLDRFRLEIASPDKWFVRASQTFDDAHNSYDLTYLGSFLQTVVDPRPGGVSYATEYVSTYAQAYNAAYAQRGNDAAAQAAARQTAAPLQLVPGSASFNEQRAVFVASNEAFRPSSYLRDVSGQYNFDLSQIAADLIVGGAYREFRLGSGGNFFGNEAGKRIRNYEYGGYAQLIKTVLGDRLKLAAAGRLDNFQNFDAAFSPRVSAVLSLGEQKQHNFRASFGQAFRSPTQLDQYVHGDLNVGILLGNVSGGYQGYSTRLVSDYQSGQFNPANLASYQVEVSQLKSERVSSVEVGYKTALAERVLFDVSYYRSRYQNFIAPVQFVGNTDGSRPNPLQLLALVQNPGSQAGQLTRLIQVAANLDQQVRTQGAVLALTYAAAPAFNLTGNYALSVLENSAAEVPFFNTPKHKFNVGAYGNLTKTLGYNFNYRRAEGYRYASPFATGTLATYQPVDAQLRLGLTKLQSVLELGATNLFNTTNVQIFGAPQIGRLVYGGLVVTVK